MAKEVPNKRKKLTERGNEMTIEIKEAYVRDKKVKITGEYHRRNKENLNQIEVHSIEFEFDLHDRNAYNYIFWWLRKQIAVQKAHPKKLHEACYYTIGTKVQAPRKEFQVA